MYRTSTSQHNVHVRTYIEHIIYVKIAYRTRTYMIINTYDLVDRVGHFRQ